MARKEPSFAERLQTAAKAKQVQMEKIRAVAQANEAQSAERLAAQVEAENTRQTRIAERKLANRVAAERRRVEQAAEAARLALAAAEEKARKEAERIARAKAEEALKNEQKAARDSRYAARKARQK